MRDDALTYAKTHQTDNLTELKALTQIPSVSTLPEHNDDINHAATWLQDKFINIGLENATILPTDGKPIVYADWLNAGDSAPTILIYGHYDVQPVDPLEEWLSPPFEPTVRDDYLYARGSSDNKGQLYVHIAALEAYLKTSKQLPINVKLIFEGEEEVGSPNLRDFIVQNQEKFKADIGLVSDTHILDAQSPVIVASVRGLTYMEITLRGSDQDLHSGSYGGTVANPLNVLTRMLGSIHDEQGRVTIPKFYDKVRPLTAEDKKLLNNGLVTAEKILKETGAPNLWGESDYTVAERIGARPTFDVHGIKGGFVGAGAKTVIPAVASAKVSMRLIPDQDPEEIAELFSQHIRNLCPDTMELSVMLHSCEHGAILATDSPAIDAAAKAYEIGFGNPPIYLREGGTLPIVSMLQDIFDIPVVMMGFGLPDDHIHSPNERFYLPNFYRGIETAIHYYDIVST